MVNFLQPDCEHNITSIMLQDDVALADVVKNLSEQLQQVQSQLAEQQATITEQQAFIEAQHLEQTRQTDALTERVNRQEEVNAEQARLNDAKFFRLESQCRASECFKDEGNHHSYQLLCQLYTKLYQIVALFKTDI